MRIVHLSDLHFGRHDAVLPEGLAEEVSRQMPKLSGGERRFPQVGSAGEFAAARHFIDQLQVPVFAVPGNHDVPAWNVPLRFADPYRYYRRYIAEDLEPFLEIEERRFGCGIKSSAAPAALALIGHTAQSAMNSSNA